MDDMKNSSQCGSDMIPSISAYLSAINVYGIILVISATIALIFILIMFIDTLRYIMGNLSGRIKSHSLFVASVYPVVAFATYFAILVPRAHLLAEALTQGAFMAGMYRLFCLFLAYCGGQNQLIDKSDAMKLNLKQPPCCCYPCCSLLPQLDVNRRTIKILRFLVFQLPLVQCFVYLGLLVMWAERESLYQVNYLYIQPVIILSIFLGVWSMLVSINLFNRILTDEYQLKQKYIVLQLVLIFAKLQGLTTRSLVQADILPCKPPITPSVYGNLIYNCLMICEMVILTFIARRLYKRLLPTKHWVSTISTIGAIIGNDLYTDNNNKNCENLNLNLTLENRQIGHVNVAVDIIE